MTFDFRSKTRHLVSYNERSVALQVVIQVRQVNQIERGRMFLVDPLRGVSDPTRGAIGLALRRSHPRCGAPETEEGKFAQIFFDLRADGIRPRIDIEKFPAIGRIHRARRDGVIHTRIHIEPPETVRAGEVGMLRAKRFPDFGRANDGVRLLPEMDLVQFAMEPTIAHDAVSRGRFAGEIVRLRRAGDGGKCGADVR